MKRFLALLISLDLSIIRTIAQTPAPTINGTPPPFTFTGAVTQTGQNFNFTGGGGGGTVSGQVNNVVPLAGSATGITKQSHIDEITTGLTSFGQNFGTAACPAWMAAQSLCIASTASGSNIGNMNVGPDAQAIPNYFVDSPSTAAAWVTRADSGDAVGYLFPSALNATYGLDDLYDANSAATALAGNFIWNRHAAHTSIGEGIGAIGQVFVQGDGLSTNGFAIGAAGQVFVNADVQNVEGMYALAYAGYATGPVTIQQLDGVDINASDWGEFADQIDTANSIEIDSWGNFGPATTNHIRAIHIPAMSGSAGIDAYAIKSDATQPSSFAGPLQAAGTTNVTGCSLTSAVGGAWAGSFLSGTTGTCTVTVTPGNTAPNGFSCWSNNLTTPTDVMKQTATNTTTATISATTVSGDKIVWGCVAF